MERFGNLHNVDLDQHDVRAAICTCHELCAILSLVFSMLLNFYLDVRSNMWQVEKITNLGRYWTNSVKQSYK